MVRQLESRILPSQGEREQQRSLSPRGEGQGEGELATVGEDSKTPATHPTPRGERGKAADSPQEEMEVTGVCVVIPVLNEEESIAGVIARIPPDAVDEIIVADGGSKDRTAEIAKQMGARVLDAGKGYGRACMEGALAAGDGCRIAVYIDGDGSDFPEELPKLVAPILAGTHDFVIGSRARGKREPGSMAWHQLAAGWSIGAFAGLLYGVRYSDMCAFRAIRRDALLGLGMCEMTYGWNLEMQMKAARAGLRILEVPVPYACRAGGSSKVAGSLSGTLRAGSRILLTFARVALQPKRPDFSSKGAPHDRT